MPTILSSIRRDASTAGTRRFIDLLKVELAPGEVYEKWIVDAHEVSIASDDLITVEVTNDINGGNWYEVDEGIYLEPDLRIFCVTQFTGFRVINDGATTTLDIQITRH